MVCKKSIIISINKLNKKRKMRSPRKTPKITFNNVIYLISNFDKSILFSDKIELNQDNSGPANSVF